MIEQSDPTGSTCQTWLSEISRRLGRSFDACAYARFERYVSLLRQWNEKINLTAITDDEGIAIRHLLDSLTLLEPIERFEREHMDLPQQNQLGATESVRPLRLVDVGTGAGFPGLPLKIIRTDLDVLLLDSLAKRLAFLEAVIKELDLDGIHTWHDRAEDAGHRVALRGQFDLVTARAVAPLPVLCEYCLPLLRHGGLFLAMKGNPETEWPGAANAVRTLGGKLDGIQTFNLPGTEMQRSIIAIRKTGKTPVMYPRKAGKPEKQPL
jgi:16S rRNA (guanine527-N7)-methyltransferase